MLPPTQRVPAASGALFTSGPWKKRPGLPGGRPEQPSTRSSAVTEAEPECVIEAPEPTVLGLVSQ